MTRNCWRCGCRRRCCSCPASAASATTMPRTRARRTSCSAVRCSPMRPRRLLLHSILGAPERRRGRACSRHSAIPSSASDWPSCWRCSRPRTRPRPRRRATSCASTSPRGTSRWSISPSISRRRRASLTAPPSPARPSGCAPPIRRWNGPCGAAGPRRSLRCSAPRSPSASWGGGGRGCPAATSPPAGSRRSRSRCWRRARGRRAGPGSTAQGCRPRCRGRRCPPRSASLPPARRPCPPDTSLARCRSSGVLLAAGADAIGGTRGTAGLRAHRPHRAARARLAGCHAAGRAAARPAAGGAAHRAALRPGLVAGADAAGPGLRRRGGDRGRAVSAAIAASRRHRARLSPPVGCRSSQASHSASSTIPPACTQNART